MQRAKRKKETTPRKQLRGCFRGTGRGSCVELFGLLCVLSFLSSAPSALKVLTFALPEPNRLSHEDLSHAQPRCVVRVLCTALMRARARDHNADRHYLTDASRFSISGVDGTRVAKIQPSLDGQAWEPKCACASACCYGKKPTVVPPPATVGFSLGAGHRCRLHAAGDGCPPKQIACGYQLGF